jgi:hypothetical protein
MLDPRFQHVAAQYQVLRGQFDAGALDGPAFEAALRGLMIEDEGRYWHIGAASGRWFVSDGDRWVEADPPEVGPPAAEPEGLPGPGDPRPAPPPSAVAPPAATPHPVAQPTPAPAPRPAAPAAARAGGSTAMAGWGVTLLVLGLGSFILPQVGMQFRLLALFGPAQNVVALGMAAVGVILLILSRTMGGSRPAVAAQPMAARSAAPAGGAPGYPPAAPAYTPRGPGGCIIGCLLFIGGVILVVIVGFVLLWPRIEAQIRLLQAQAQAESQAQSSQSVDSNAAPADSSAAETPDGATYANGLNPPPATPSCPPGYTPGPPALGSPSSQPTCTPQQ